MNIYYIIFFFILGLIIGSFINVLVLRIDDLKSVLYTRSHCPSCKKTLAAKDLIPIISYLMLRGKCRYCQNPISIQYPLVELFCGLMFAFLFFTFGLSVQLIFYLLIFSILLVAIVQDIKTQTVPEVFVWVALGLSIITSLIFGGAITSIIWGAVIGGGVLAILSYGSKEKWMGTGDVKIGVILGVLLGYPLVILGLFMAFILGAVVGLIYIKYRGKTIKDALPFAPFLILAALLTLSYGIYLLNWYWGNLII